jgi:hypothetical protein
LLSHAGNSCLRNRIGLVKGASNLSETFRHFGLRGGASTRLNRRRIARRQGRLRACTNRITAALGRQARNKFG